MTLRVRNVDMPVKKKGFASRWGIPLTTNDYISEFIIFFLSTVKFTDIEIILVAATERINLGRGEEFNKTSSSVHPSFSDQENKIK